MVSSRWVGWRGTTSEVEKHLEQFEGLDGRSLGGNSKRFSHKQLCVRAVADEVCKGDGKGRCKGRCKLCIAKEKTERQLAIQFLL